MDYELLKENIENTLDSITNERGDKHLFSEDLCSDAAEQIINLVRTESNRLNGVVIRFVGGNEPLNVGKLKKIIADLDDDFTIDMRVRTKLTDEQLKDLSYPYPYDTEYHNLNLMI